MSRKVWLILFMLIGITFLVSCSPTQAIPTPAPNLPNPASVFCEQHGGKSENVTDADGSQRGVCIFTDGSKCDEWAYFRGECGLAQ